MGKARIWEMGFWAAALGASVGGAVPALALDAGEPEFCDPAAFESKEIELDGSGLQRPHYFHLGAVRLLGLGVGQSKVRAMRAVAGEPTSAERYCTFYFNEGNREAAETFVWEYLPKPTGTGYAKTTDEYLRRMGDLFDTRAQNFLDCAERHRYLALGCDGMKHRGPSVFAMFLGYAGCSPKRAAEIVNRVWGENGIRPEMREALAAAAARLGAAHPNQRARLQALLSGPAR